MDWYFDVISPYAYLQSTRLQELAQHEPVECVPVLFAGLLKHFENVGPAEIAAKRRWTFRHIAWLAHRDDIALNLPESHPFNPLPLLRLSIALGNEINMVQRLFRFVWVEGNTPQNELAFEALLEELHVDRKTLDGESIKQQLHQNSQRAIGLGVFGVPTITRGEQLFWGYDATDMAIAHRDRMQSSSVWPEAALQVADALPEGQGRPRN